MNNNTFSQITIFTRIIEYLDYTDKQSFLQTCKKIYKNKKLIKTKYRAFLLFYHPVYRSKLTLFIESNKKNDQNIHDFTWDTLALDEIGEFTEHEIVSYLKSPLSKAFITRNENHIVCMLCGNFKYCRTYDPQYLSITEDWKKRCDKLITLSP